MKRLLFLVLFVVYAWSVGAQAISSTDTVTVYTMKGTFYSDRFVGRKTSNGEIFTQDKYTAAHCSLKFGTLVLVTNPSTGKQVIVKINDRCPKRNVIDLTRLAARQIGVTCTTVKVRVLPPRFRHLWENQHKILDVLERGEFWKYAAEYYTSELVAQRGNQAVRPTQAPGDETPLFNLELCRCRSRNTAKKQVETLPIYYQECVSYKTNVSANEVVIVLELFAKKERAESVANELKNLFPDAKIVSAK